MKRLGSTTDSPDESLKAHEGANVNVTRILMQMSERALPTIALIVSVAALTAVLISRSDQDTRFAMAHEYQMQELRDAKRKFDLLDNDWMQMNAYLAQNGVTKDASGFYIKNGNRLQEKTK